MLISLNIENVVLIEKLTIAFDGGLCALTGETGAGKSILLDSLGLALGARAESRLVRKGAEQAQVTALFEITPDHSAFGVLEEGNVSIETGEPLILRRILTADGRSRAYINDQPVSAGLLRQIGDSLVEIHGQFDTQGLLNPATHRALLDEYAGIGGELSSSWGAWKTARAELERLQSRANNAQEEESYLRQSIEDLDALAPQEGEEETLASLRERLMNKERVLEGLNAAYHALNGEEDPVRAAWGALDRIADKLGTDGDEAINALDRASTEIQEALAQIQALSADLEQEEHSLESVDERLYQLRAQARKHQCAPDDLPQKREELAARLDAIEHADQHLEDQMRKVEQARAAYIAQAREISTKRGQIAQKLDQLVQAELVPLKLDKARFVTQIASLAEEEWGAHGMDQVRFLVATNPGAEPGPINKIASGGEMSRFMLALKVVMAEVGSAGTLVFDEVDAGIGGSTADAVGERLARLGQERQVLVVTHAPQVAARANHHYIVRKDGVDDVQTNIIALHQNEERREEIARMLAGASITAEARAAADKLLEAG